MKSEIIIGIAIAIVLGGIVLFVSSQSSNMFGIIEEELIEDEIIEEMVEKPEKKSFKINLSDGIGAGDI